MAIGQRVVLVQHMKEVMPSTDEVYDRLRQVDDPELGLNLVDLGLIYGVTVNDGHVRIAMTLTTRGCPMHVALIPAVPGCRRESSRRRGRRGRAGLGSTLDTGPAHAAGSGRSGLAPLKPDCTPHSERVGRAFSLLWTY